MNSAGGGPPVIVIGAGIVGAATAAFLTQAGVAVRLFEAVAPSSGATGAADGAVSVASKRPGLMMAFARAGLEFYRDMARRGLIKTEFQARPSFLVASTLSEAEVLSRHAQALTEAGVPLIWHEAGAVRQRIAGLAHDTIAMLEACEEGHAVGFRVVDRLLALSGLRVERGVQVDGILRDGPGGVVTGVMVEGQVIPASAVVVAAGSGSAKLLGFDAVARPRKGQQIVTERAAGPMLPGSIISASYLLSKQAQAGQADPRGYGIVIDQQPSGQFLIGSTREEGKSDCDNDLQAVAHMARSAAHVLPELSKLRVIRCFAGVRAAMADGLPVIGQTPDAENLFVATGFEGDGICLGPLTGHIMAGLVRGIPSPFDLTPFSPARLFENEAAA